jgi:alkanesulfonate monooxygenase SsuD/methylene tetrahydromethanopterin reductase-like flavin-dependent oxidoreductase (luciferase family)
MFLNPCTVKQGKKVIAEARAAAAAERRDPASLKFFPCIVPIIGRTEEEAKKKHEKALSVADAIGGLAQFSGYTGIDMSVFPLDEPFTSSTLKGGASIQSVLNAFEASTDSSSMDSASSEPWTPRRLGMRMALGGLHPCPIGSVSQVADVFEEWITEADCDGFNVAYVSNPSIFEDVVDLLVPELQRRGLMWDDYDFPGGTFRENMLGTRVLREDHYGSRFKYGREEVKSIEAEQPVAAEIPEVQEKSLPTFTSQPIAI